MADLAERCLAERGGAADDFQLCGGVLIFQLLRATKGTADGFVIEYSVPAAPAIGAGVLERNDSVEFGFAGTVADADAAGAQLFINVLQGRNIRKLREVVRQSAQNTAGGKNIKVTLVGRLKRAVDAFGVADKLLGNSYLLAV